MNKKTSRILAGVITAALVTAVIAQTLNDIYISPTGTNAGSCPITAPCKTLTYALTKAVAGDIIHLADGTYPAESSVTGNGVQGKPITIVGAGAVLKGLTIQNSSWLVFDGLTFTNTRADSVDLINKNQFIVFRNNHFNYLTRGIYIHGYSSHILVENNDFTQSCSIGKTWTQLKGSTCEGGAVYGSSYGGGSYTIRFNTIHEVFNGFLFVDDSAGQWMNSNVFIYGNQFTNVIDDPFEPEGDSFNIHFYDNTLTETHRLASLTTAGLGPVFVYGNYQHVDGNPTGEAARSNSALKLDTVTGFTNGAWVFNNTVDGFDASNFYFGDLQSSASLKRLTTRNNVISVARVMNSAPTIGTGASLDWDVSKTSFGFIEPHGLVADPRINQDGTLQAGSPAIGRSAEVSIPVYFVGGIAVASGQDAGAFAVFGDPVWVIPPGGYPAAVVPHIENWFEAGTITPVPVTATVSLTSTATRTRTPIPFCVTATPAVTPLPVCPLP
jgi:hypothetical protein